MLSSELRASDVNPDSFSILTSIQLCVRTLGIKKMRLHVYVSSKYSRFFKEKPAIVHHQPRTI